jgi:hypothetical protein
MKDKHTIAIQVNPLNPVQYLACCGVFAVLSRFDAWAVSHWILNPQKSFSIESRIDEQSILEALVTSFTDRGRWKLVPSSQKPVRIDFPFTLGGHNVSVSLDWWYETLNQDGEIAEKSAWKMYAGNQTVEGLSQAMIETAIEIRSSTKPLTLTDLMGLHQGMTGRFGFDPRASRNALDTGFSANDLKLPIATYPFAELLASIGAQQFFPHRTHQSNGIKSTRGWVENKVYQYALWTIALPISLARVAASCAAIEEESKLQPIQSVRASRDKYSNLTMATAIQLQKGN